MKRLLMLKPYNCASGDTIEGKIYDIIEDNLLVYGLVEDDEDESKKYEYTKENVEKYSNFSQNRWITIKDESSRDDFEVYENDDRFIIFENDRELAHELVNRVEGLDRAVVNLAQVFRK